MLILGPSIKRLASRSRSLIHPHLGSLRISIVIHLFRVYSFAFAFFALCTRRIGRKEEWSVVTAGDMAQNLYAPDQATIDTWVEPAIEAFRVCCLHHLMLLLQSEWIWIEAACWYHAALSLAYTCPDAEERIINPSRSKDEWRK